MFQTRGSASCLALKALWSASASFAIGLEVEAARAADDDFGVLTAAEVFTGTGWTLVVV